MLTPLHGYLKKRFSLDLSTEWEGASVDDLKNDWTIPKDWEECLSKRELVYGELYTYKLATTPDPATNFSSKAQHARWHQDNRMIDVMPEGTTTWRKMKRKSAQEIAGGQGAFFDARLYQKEIIKTSVAWFKLKDEKRPAP